jgi:hypothetical protein
MNKIAPCAKAVVGGLVSGLAAASVALTDGTVTPVEWIAVALAFIAGTGFVYAVPNKPAA